MKNQYHVIILGGGIAGLSCALFLKRNGIDDVLILNRNSHNVHKACSGILTERSINLLKEIGINPSNYLKWDGVKAFYNGEPSRIYPNNVYAYQNTGLNRVSLDEDMYTKCLEEGVNILENVKTINIDEKRNKINNFSYDYLLDARGYSVIANQNKNKIFGIEAKINSEDTQIDTIIPRIHLSHKIKGYGWIVSYKNSITIGLVDKYSAKKDYKAMLFKFALENNIVIDKNNVDLRAAFAPIKPSRKLRKNNILFIGDRAGLIDPLTQEGICYALLSGKLASEAIKKDNISFYQKSLKPVINSLNRAYTYRTIFFKKSFQQKLWNVTQKHHFTNVLFQKYSETDFFDYKKILAYHKNYKKSK